MESVQHNHMKPTTASIIVVAMRFDIFTATFPGLVLLQANAFGNEVGDSSNEGVGIRLGGHGFHKITLRRLAVFPSLHRLTSYLWGYLPISF